MAMAGDRIVKVQCKTCKKDHTFKAPKGVTDPSVAKAKAEKKKATKAEKAAASKEEATQHIGLEWQKLMSQHKNVPLKSYSSKIIFNLGDRIAHPSFGDGIITRLIYPNKVEIVFQTDLKILIHGGMPTA